jgi:hypothetical protein
VWASLAVWESVVSTWALLASLALLPVSGDSRIDYLTAAVLQRQSD